MSLNHTRCGRLWAIALAAIALGGQPESTLAQSGAEQFGSDVYWNATPNDMNNLLRGLSERDLGEYRMDIRTVGAIDPNPEQNPILFRTGHYRFFFTPEERERLREYMLNGGMMIFNTGLGSMPFYRSAVHELEQIFPEQPLQRLSSDHPIFHSFYDIDQVEYTPAVRAAGFRGNEPWFDAIEINCRVVALVSRWGLAVGWQGAVEDEHQAYQPESAFRLGVNILTYATSMRAWAQNAAHAMRFVEREEAATDRFNLGQVMYDGVWRTRHAGISLLLQSFNQRTGVPVRFGLRELRLTDGRLFDSPVLYISGHEHFELNDAEQMALRTYLQSGGLLIGESCCGRRGFDAAFRRMIEQVLPGQSLRAVPSDSPLFRHPNDIRQLAVTPAMMEESGSATISPRIEGVQLDGAYAVLYSPLGMAGGWELSPSPYAHGYDPVGSTRLGENLLFYSITQ